MARPRTKQPAYRYHVSGQAVVTLGGKDFYLGKHDSPESHAKYHRLVGDYVANGLVAPEEPTHQADEPITVACVTAEFRPLAKTKYANSPGHLSKYNSLCDQLDDEYGHTLAIEFGPRKLARLRESFIKAGNCRKYVNAKTKDVCAIFRYAVSCELVDYAVYERLRTLEPLRQGQTEARESEPVQPVELDVVRMTAKHLSPVLKAMIALQAGTAMRPSELTRMRPCDIEQRKDGVWIYRPSTHKTKHRGKSKSIPIVGDLKLTLKPFLDREQEQFCFSPRESAQWYRDQRTANRITPDGPGRGKVGSNRRANPKRQPREQWTSDAYRRAIDRAAKKAKVQHWTPYQLRHRAATDVRAALGLEYSTALLGHSSMRMTELYAKVSEQKAIQASMVAPSI